MPDNVDHIRYDLLVREALRGVVRRVLGDVARNGLPGEHHLYIAFDTRMPGVRISPRLREQYPEEMTVVLQHQFWDLAVDDEKLEVGLSFGGVPEKLILPFDAMKGFFDPSVQFGLEFDPAAARADAHGTDDAQNAPAESAAQTEPDDDGPQPDGGAEVVRLDRFRKK
ncbi:MAG: hypothetical protein J0H62_04385 [Rhizobiales bacterium]|nr:hypothetical protein [Hyphomicrobiales bacterium]